MKKLVAVSRCSSVHHGCCPVRAAGRLPGAGHGVRGENPLYTPCTPVLPFVREREICLLSWAVPRPPRVAWGVGANLPRPVAGVMSAPAAALRPPFGRPGSPPRPQHAASAARDGRGDLAGRSGGGKLADRRAVFLSFVGSCRNAFHLWRTGEVAPVSRRVKGRSLMLRGGLCVLLFSGGILCCFSRAISV